jgi:poly-gamma-glutamate capsule biosynthesis protein CapA/YwtB (metallophosphatase superfamily)
MDRRSFLKHVARATAVAGTAAGWSAADTAAAVRAAAAGGLPPNAQGAAAAAIAPDAGSPAAAPAPAGTLTLVGAGDCILSRRVRDLKDPDFVALVELVRGADCAWGNCETVIGRGGDLYPAYKFIDLHVIADPWVADELRWMGFKLMGTANNHTGDFGDRGLVSTLENLDRAGIAHAGSGLDLDQAALPGFADSAAGRVGLVSCASTFPSYFAAGPANPLVKGRPGLNPLRVKDQVVLDEVTFHRLQAARKVLADLGAEQDYRDLLPTLPPPDPRKLDFGEMTIVSGDGTDYQSTADPLDVKRITAAIALARGTSRVVIASIHAHEARHKLEISDLFLQPFARATIDAGADVYFSSGPHVLRGIEIYKGRPIFYSLSNFFFQGETSRYAPAEDYAGVGLDIHTADPAAILRRVGFARQRRFWQSVLPRLTFERDRLTAVELFPLTLGFDNPPYQRGTPRLARGPEAAAILGTVAALSLPYGTVIDIQEGVGRIRLG